MTPGIDRVFSGLRDAGAALGPLLAAALLASAWSPAARAAEPSPNVAALPVTSFGPNGLPQVLSEADADRYARIFTLLEEGKNTAADKLIRELVDKRLLGHALAIRYLHPTAYRSKYIELRNWLRNYADHPDARRIYRLALKRKPRNYRRPPGPAVNPDSLAAQQFDREPPYRSAKKLSGKQRRRVVQLKRQIRRNVRLTRLSVTERLLNTREVRRLFDDYEIDEAKGMVASAWFYYGNDKRAYRLAAAAAKRSGDRLPLVHWTAGLAAWRTGVIEKALDHFQRLALAPNISDWNAASGAFWAARALQKLGQPFQARYWLTIAAKYRYTFYGLLAQKALGSDGDFDFSAPPLTPIMAEQLLERPNSSRALALIQVGQRSRAEQDLLRIDDWRNPTMAGALFALADRAQLPALAFRLTRRLQVEGNAGWLQDRLEAGLYPLPPWEPRDGFKVDRALLYALMRQESAFNPHAKSPAGARGLMQIMPRTASYIARDRRYRRGDKRALFEPSLNMELSQRYLSYLLEHKSVQGDLLRLAAAYNGGPGNLNKWLRKMKYGDDPLMFIESLPSRETRLFIERVFANLWVYRKRLGQPAPSQDALLADDWPEYRPLDSSG